MPFNFQRKNYETLGGLIVHLTEEIPEEGQHFVENYTLKVTQVTATKIERVELLQSGVKLP